RREGRLRKAGRDKPRPYGHLESHLLLHSAVDVGAISDEQKGDVMKVLLAVDGSSGSNAAVEEVATRPLAPGSAIRVISVAEVPFVPTPDTWALPETYLTEMEKAAEEQAQSALTAARERIRATQGEKVDISLAVIQGHPKEAILDEAERWGADLIVVGSHGYRGWQRFLLGSVSQAIASHASCSVQIVRIRQATPTT
ncbi:MAG: universal stress protein, partial [Acidobacteriota bacterium]